jgi:hypothetical protein
LASITGVLKPVVNTTQVIEDGLSWWMKTWLVGLRKDMIAILVLYYSGGRDNQLQRIHPKNF